MKYAFIGSHGTGKSSAAHFLAAKLKKEDPTKSIKVIEESVRITSKLVSINNANFQKASILGNLYDQVIYKSVYDIVICDRIAFDYLVYGKHFNIELSDAYRDMCIENAKKFDKIYFVRPDNAPIADDGFRFTDIEERNKIDLLFQDMLNYHEIPYEEIRTEDVFK